VRFLTTARWAAPLLEPVPLVILASGDAPGLSV